MANLQRAVISLLLILTATFLFLAQTSNAAKGPKITNKVGMATSLKDLGALLIQITGIL